MTHLRQRAKSILSMEHSLVGSFVLFPSFTSILPDLASYLPRKEMSMVRYPFQDGFYETITMIPLTLNICHLECVSGQFSTDAWPLLILHESGICSGSAPRHTLPIFFLVTISLEADCLVKSFPFSLLYSVITLDSVRCCAVYEKRWTDMTRLVVRGFDS